MDYEQKYKQALEIAKSMMALPDDKAMIEEIFPELKESEDEFIREKLIIRFLGYDDEESFGGIKIKDILAWLEKQGEQKPVDKVKPKFREGDNIQFKGFGHNRYTIKEVCGLSHYINTMGNRMDMSYTDANFEVIKDCDKVEPKFKVGDWVVYCGKTCKITGLNNGIFTITNQDGSYFFNQVKSTMEPVFHRLIIEDAKDGK